MGFFVWVGLIAVAAGIAYLILHYMHEEPKEVPDRYGNTKTTDGFPGKFIGVLVLIAAGIAIFLITIFSASDQVENGHVGIKKQFSAIVGQPTGDGLQFHAPWQSLDDVSVQNEKRTYKMGEQGINTGNVGVDVTGGSAVSRDSQAISLFVQVNYSLQKDKVVDLYRATGGHFLERVLDNAVFQESKSQTAKFAATEFAANRETVRQNIERSLAEVVGSKGITIQNVSLLDVGYSPGLAAAIEKTVEARQRAIAAEAQVKVVQAEAQQKVAKAQGDAQALVTNAKAASTAQRLRRRTLTPLLVQEEAIKALNPNVSVIVCAAGKVCIPQAVIATANAGN